MLTCKMCLSILLGSIVCLLILLGSIVCLSILLGSIGCLSILLGSIVCLSILLGSIVYLSILLGSIVCLSVLLGSIVYLSILLGSIVCLSMLHGNIVCLSIFRVRQIVCPVIPGTPESVVGPLDILPGCSVGTLDLALAASEISEIRLNHAAGGATIFILLQICSIRTLYDPSARMNIRYR